MRAKKKIYEELWIKIKDLIRSITKISDIYIYIYIYTYIHTYVKIKFDLDEDLPLNKRIGICGMIIFVRAIFLENSKYYPMPV